MLKKHILHIAHGMREEKIDMNNDFGLDLRHSCRGLGFYTLYIYALHIIYIWNIK